MSETKYIQRTKTVILADGTEKRLKGVGKTEKEALMKLAKKVADFESGKLFITKKTTFKRYAEEYLEIYKKPAVVPETLKNDECRLRLYFYPNIGNTPLERVTTSMIQQCLNEMQATELSQDYIKKSYNLVFNIFDQARKDRLIQYNNVENCTLPQGRPARKRRALTEDERRYFLSACEQSPKGIVYLVSYYCGLRPAEVRALRWKNIDIKNGKITITNRVNGKGNLKPPKSQAGYRTIPIPKVLLNHFQRMPRNINPDAFAFGSDKAMTKQNYERGWNYIKRLMDIEAGALVYRNQIVQSKIDKDLSPYFLRHTYCTRLAENNIPLKTAQYLMGHSSIEMTANIYTHITQKMMEASEQAIKAL